LVLGGERGGWERGGGSEEMGGMEGERRGERGE